jgi:hypothetical protein
LDARTRRRPDQAAWGRRGRAANRRRCPGGVGWPGDDVAPRRVSRPETGRTPKDVMDAVANRLANETSPYLQQHQDNPVDWKRVSRMPAC